MSKLQIKYQGTEKDEKPVFHHFITDQLYFQAYLCSKTHSGKTSSIFCLLKKIAIPFFTKILFVSSSLQYDLCYQKTVQDIRSLNSLQILNEFDEEKIMEFLQEEENEIFNKLKYKCVPKILVIDDNRQHLKSKFCQQLSTKMRHFHAACFWVGHSICDIPISSRGQMQILIIYKSQCEQALQRIYDEYIQDTNQLDFYTFQDIYIDATEKKYNFLFIDIVNQELRKNIDKKYVYDKEQDQFFLQDIKL